MKNPVLGTQRLQTPYARKMKKLRQSTVEPVLGTLINFMGLRRIWTRGINSANKFMLGAAIAYNLKKYMNYQQTKFKIEVMELKKPLSSSIFLFLMLYRFTLAYNIKSSKYYSSC